MPSAPSHHPLHRLASGLLVLGAALSLLAPTPGDCHDLEEARRGIITLRAGQTTPLQVDALLMMEVPPGERAQRTIGLYDLDRSGSLNAVESRMVAAALGAEVVVGYVLTFQGQPVRPDEIKASAMLGPRGGVLVAILLGYHLTPTPGSPPRVEVKLQQPLPGGPQQVSPLALELQVTAPLRIQTSSRPPAPDAPVVGPMTLRPDTPGVWIELALPPSPPALPTEAPHGQ